MGSKALTLFTIYDFDLLSMKKIIYAWLIFITVMLVIPLIGCSQDNQSPVMQLIQTQDEVPDNPYMSPAFPQRTSPARRVKSTGFSMVQVNVNASGQNILGDAANEPSLAIDPADPSKIVIGWRQFDNVNSNFRQAGFAFSADFGQTWTFPGVIEQGIFRSDPVLDCDPSGIIYYNSLTSNTGGYSCKVFKSNDGGALWDNGTEAHGGDKQWMTIDRTNGVGSGNIYSFWSKNNSSCFPGYFTRSTDEGASYESCVAIPYNPYYGTLAVGNQGELYVAGAGPGGLIVEKSSNVKIPGSSINFELASAVDLDGYLSQYATINPDGMVGQAYIDVDRSGGPGLGNVYVLASVARLSNSDPADVMFAKSIDGGLSWSQPKKINTDPSLTNFQWFGTLSVAPNGRIDIIWLDTRDALAGSDSSSLYYSWSTDQGETWSANEKLSGSFNPHVGYPQQNKMGDYFDMKSDDDGASLAWANTLNGEEDVYFSRIIPQITGIGNGDATLPSLLLTASPNPFHDIVAIKYRLTAPCQVKLVVYDVYGTVIKKLVESKQQAGNYSVNFSDNALPSGFYICRLSAGTQSGSVRLVKLK
jgi:hypothetical protein